MKFAEEIGSEVIIEGIENVPDLNMAKELGISNIQGFLFSRPIELIPEHQVEFAKELIKKAS
jgi:EAL domain-containing protein (putative c-di-GMP-specific phosphodiesterase class I)